MSKENYVPSDSNESSSVASHSSSSGNSMEQGMNYINKFQNDKIRELTKGISTMNKKYNDLDYQYKQLKEDYNILEFKYSALVASVGIKKSVDNKKSKNKL